MTSIEHWTSFFQTTASGAATLAGMVVVAISINLGRILEAPALPGRAAEALIPLAGVAVISLLGLTPDQPITLFGWETLVAGALIWTSTTVIHRRSVTAHHADPRTLRWPRILLANVQSLPFVAAGVLLIQEGAHGLYWIVPGVILCLIAGILNTWVLLIEILR